MELFTLGVGQYDEADVRAGAAALTGWRLRPRQGRVALDPARHDDAPQRYLGVEGVHDLAGVVSALAAHPALPPFVSGAVAAELLGPSDPAAVAPLAAAFTASGLRIDALVRAALEAGLAGAERPGRARAGAVAGDGAEGHRRRPSTRRPGSLGLRAAGQLPMLPAQRGRMARWPGLVRLGHGRIACQPGCRRRRGHRGRAAGAGGGRRWGRAAGRGAGAPRPRLRPGHGGCPVPPASARQRLALALTSPEVVLA